MKFQSFFTAILLSFSPLFSQHLLNLSLNSGIGKSALITDFESENNKIVSTLIEDEFCTSFIGQLEYSYQIKNWSIETGVGYNFIGGSTTEKFNSYNIFNNFEYNQYTSHETRRLHYLTIPFLANYHHNRFQFGSGFYASYLITDYSFYTFYLNEIPELGFLQGGKRLNKFDLGIRSKIKFNLSSKIAIQSLFNWGFLNVDNGYQKGAAYYIFQTDPASNRKIKNRQLLFGIAYTLL
jgi:hypothetical protein